MNYKIAEMWQGIAFGLNKVPFFVTHTTLMFPRTMVLLLQVISCTNVIDTLESSSILQETVRVSSKIAEEMYSTLHVFTTKNIPSCASTICEIPLEKSKSLRARSRNLR